MLLSIFNVFCWHQAKKDSKRSYRLNEVSDFSDIIEPLESNVKLFGNNQNKIELVKGTHKRVNRNSNAPSVDQKRHIKRKHYKKRRKRLFGLKSDDILKRDDSFKLNKLKFYPKSSELKFAPTIRDVSHQKASTHYKKLKNLKKRKDANVKCSEKPMEGSATTEEQLSSTSNIVCITNSESETAELPFEWEDEMLKNSNIELKRDIQNHQNNNKTVKVRYLPQNSCAESEDEVATTSEECNTTPHNCDMDEDDSECSNDDEEQADNDSICNANKQVNNTGCGPGQRKRKQCEIQGDQADMVSKALENIKLSNQYISNAVKPLSIAQENLEKLGVTNSNTKATTEKKIVTSTEENQISKIVPTLKEVTASTQMQKALVKENTLAFENSIDSSSTLNYGKDSEECANFTEETSVISDDSKQGVTKGTKKINEFVTEQKKGMAILDVTTESIAVSSVPSSSSSNTDTTLNIKSAALSNTHSEPSFEEMENCGSTSVKSTSTSSKYNKSSANLDTSSSTLNTILNLDTSCSLETTSHYNVEKITNQLKEATVSPEKGMGLAELTTSVVKLDTLSNDNTLSTTNPDILKSTELSNIQQNCENQVDITQNHKLVDDFGKLKRESVFEKSLELLKKKLDIGNINDESDFVSEDMEKEYKQKRLERDLRLIKNLENILNKEVKLKRAKRRISSFNVPKENIDNIQETSRRKRFLFGNKKKKKKKKKVWKKLYSRDFVSNKNGRFLNHGHQNSP